jgi:glutamate synthase domain-containing protein 2
MDAVTVSVLLVGLGIKLFYAVVAVVFILLTIRVMDKLFGIDVKGWLQDSSDVTKAIYFGARMVALCYLFGSILS